MSFSIISRSNSTGYRFKSQLVSGHLPSRDDILLRAGQDHGTYSRGKGSNGTRDLLARTKTVLQDPCQNFLRQRRFLPRSFSTSPDLLSSPPPPSLSFYYLRAVRVCIRVRVYETAACFDIIIHSTHRHRRRFSRLSTSLSRYQTPLRNRVTGK